MKAYTWEKDSNELIDYDQAELMLSSHILNSSKILYRFKDNVAANTKGNYHEISQKGDYQKLCEITKEKDKYYFHPNKKEITSQFNDLSNLSWLIYKAKKFPQKSRPYRISEGDILKIGRIWLIVREIKINKAIINYNDSKDSSRGSIKEVKYNVSNISFKYNHRSSSSIGLRKSAKNKRKDLSYKDENNSERETQNELSTPDKNSKILLKINKKNTTKLKKTKHKKSKRICRICYMGEDDDDLKSEESSDNSEGNPLIQPCNCAGSMRFIHLNCLRHWLSSKILVKTSSFSPVEFCTSYLINKVQCELCKENLPDFIRYKGKLLELLDFNPDEKENYIVFDTISPDKDNNRFRHVVKFNKDNKIKIGRGLDVQLMLNDISVSRIHCVLTIVKGNRINLEDFGSKFGTLVLLQCPKLEITRNERLYVQIGRTYLTVEIKKPFQFFNCCDTNEVDSEKSYDQVNKNYISFDKITYIKDCNSNDDSDDEDEEEPSNEKSKIINSKGNGFLKIISEENGTELNNKTENEEEKRGNIKRRKTALKNF